MGLTCGHGAWQIDRQSNGSMWDSYSFQPVGQWMGYSFTDLGAEGCCRSLNALFIFMFQEHWCQTLPRHAAATVSIMAEKDQSPSSSIGAYLYSCLYTLHHSDGWNLLQTLVESSINLSRRGIIHRSTLNQEQESESPQSYDCDERQNGTDVDGAKGIPDSSYVDGISAKAVPDFRLELQGNEELNLEQFEQLGAESSDFETMEEPQGAMGGVVTSVSDQDRHWSWEDYEPEEYWDEEDTQPFVMPKPIPQPKKCSESCRKSRYCPNSKENRRLNDSPEQDCGESVPRASGLESLVETADTRRDSEDQDDFVYIPQKNGRKLFVKNISFQVGIKKDSVELNLLMTWSFTPWILTRDTP